MADKRIPLVWDFLRNPPETATRWPTLAEIGAAAEHGHPYLPLSGGKLAGDLEIAMPVNVSSIFLMTEDTGNHGVYIKYKGASSNTLHYGTRDNRTDYDWGVVQRGSHVMTFRATPKVNGVAVSLAGHTHDYLSLSGGTLTSTLNTKGFLRAGPKWRAMIAASSFQDEVLFGGCNEGSDLINRYIRLGRNHKLQVTEGSVTKNVYHEGFHSALAQKSSSGYWKDKQTGLIFQWGRAWGGMDYESTTPFPIAFPNACLNVQVTTPYNYAVKNHYKGASKTGITVWDLPVTQAVHYFAVGY